MTRLSQRMFYDKSDCSNSGNKFLNEKSTSGSQLKCSTSIEYCLRYPKCRDWSHQSSGHPMSSSDENGLPQKSRTYDMLPAYQAHITSRQSAEDLCIQFNTDPIFVTRHSLCSPAYIDEDAISTSAGPLVGGCLVTTRRYVFVGRLVAWLEDPWKTEFECDVYMFRTPEPRPEGLI